MRVAHPTLLAESPAMLGELRGSIFRGAGPPREQARVGSGISGYLSLILNTSHRVALLAIFWCVGTASASTVVGSGPGYVIRISDGDRVAVLEIETAEYEEWADGLVDTSGVRSMTGRLYDHFHDDFDFIVFSSNETSVRPGVYFGRHFAAQNDTAGIGKSLFDVSDLYGSLGALQSAIHLPSISGLRGGPSLHEFVHRWGVSLPDISGSSHWGSRAPADSSVASNPEH